jgi:hypothetical protein
MSRLQELAGAEVMTWDLGRIEMAASEVQGPIVVRRPPDRDGNPGDSLGVYPFYAHPVMDRGTLWVLDPSVRPARVLAEFPGFVGSVAHEPKYAGWYVGKRGGPMVR